jgi:hypothetical protein
LIAEQKPGDFGSSLPQVGVDKTVRGVVDFDKGQYIFIKRGGLHGSPEDSLVTVVDGMGLRVFQRSPALDLASDIFAFNLLAATLRTPNRLVVSAAVRSHADQHASVLFEYDIETNDLVRVVKTNPFQCIELQGHDDGTLWCLGLDVAKANAGLQDFDLVYHLNAEGALLSSHLPQSVFHATLDRSIERLHPWGPTDESWPRFQSRNRELWLWLPSVRELITFEPDGRIRERIVLPTFHDTVVHETYAIGPNGSVFALLDFALDDPRIHRRKSIYFLSADRKGWLLLAGGPTEDPGIPLSVALVGADEKGLLLWDARARRVVSFPIAPDRFRVGS